MFTVRHFVIPRIRWIVVGLFVFDTHTQPHMTLRHSSFSRTLLCVVVVVVVVRSFSPLESEFHNSNK